jgi:hypothetical protein
MKLKATVTILASVVAMGSALAQKPSIVQNTRNTMNAVSNQQQAASNQALGVREKVPTAANATHAQANQPKKSGAPAASAKTSTSSRAAGHATEANARHHRRGHWVGGVWIADYEQPGLTEGRQEEPVASNQPVAAQNSEYGESNEQSVVPDSRSSANGRRDPFISPVVSHAGGSGCSTGKKCLEIGTINLRGVVHAETGFIAVVSNGLNKAYFLHENDPVFNGYVVKITGDSIVFQERLQDRLGKSFTREVVKKITAPAV